MKEYTVRTGRHYSRFLPRFWAGATSFNVKGRFTEQSKYITGDRNQFDWCKTWGVSFGFDNHYNSARWAHRYNPATNLFELAPYCYSKGKRIAPEEPLFSVTTGQDFDMALSIHEKYWKFWYGTDGFNADRESDEIPHGTLANFGLKLNYYLGGDFTVKHDTTILLDW